MSGVRPDTGLGCNCVTPGGGIVPSGQPAIKKGGATTGTVLGATSVTVKVLNTRTTSAKGISAFLVSTEGTLSVVSLPAISPGQIAEHIFSLSSPGPFVAGILEEG